MSFGSSFFHFDFNPTGASNDSLERSSINDFLVDFFVNFLVDLIMLFCILLISAKISYFFASGLILTDLHPSSSFIFLLFYFIFFYLCQCVFFHQLLLLIYTLENVNQFDSLGQSGSMISFENAFTVFVITDSFLFIVISCNLNPNLLLKSSIFFVSFSFASRSFHYSRH